MTNMDLEGSAQALVSLGFSGFEAEVYVRLLSEPEPVTGYKVAQALGKPVANTYKALESLSNKGAVIIDDGSSRLCRAVAADELLSKLERRFRDNQRKAARSLAKIRSSSSDDRVYQLRTSEQVFERCRRMLSMCKQVALLDIFPVPLEELRHDIQAVAARGIQVALKAYRPVHLDKVEVFTAAEGDVVLERWPGQWLNLVVDGKEMLLCFLSSDGAGVHQAIWSGSAYLCCVFHSALLSEIVLSGVQEKIEERASPGQLRELVRRYCSVDSIRGMGYKELLGRFSASDQK
jgi:sugar-specific transcriptional regulator TrmB